MSSKVHLDEIEINKMNFEWNYEKNNTNFKKHGVTFSEAISIFCDPFELTIIDPDHSVSGLALLAAYPYCSERAVDGHYRS